MRSYYSTTAAIALGTLFAISGCGESDQATPYTQAEVNVPDPHSHDHAHAHAHEGPHGGHVIEFTDDHSHHAEVAFDKETRTISVYFYGASLDSPEAVAVDGFEFELEGDDDEIELESKPVPQDGDAEGTASQFEIAGDVVPEAIDDIEKLHGHFHVRIGDTEYVGAISHDHGDGHGHDHGDEHGHDEDKDGHHKDGEDKDGHDDDGDGHHKDGEDKDGDDGDHHKDGDDKDADAKSESGEAKQDGDSEEKEDS